jgi:hypothetical protein
VKGKGNIEQEGTFLVYSLNRFSSFIALKPLDRPAEKRGSKETKGFTFALGPFSASKEKG